MAGLKCCPQSRAATSAVSSSAECSDEHADRAQGSLAEELERAEAEEARFREARLARAREMNRKVPLTQCHAPDAPRIALKSLCMDCRLEVSM